MAEMRPDSLISVLYKLFAYLLSCLFISLKIGPSPFETGGRKRQPNLALVLCMRLFCVVVHFGTDACLLMLCEIISFSVLSPEIGWNGHL